MRQLQETPATVVLPLAEQVREVLISPAGQLEEAHKEVGVGAAEPGSGPRLLEVVAQDSGETYGCRIYVTSPRLGCNHRRFLLLIMMSKVELKAHDYYADKEWGCPLMLRDRRYPRRGVHGETVHEIGRRIVSGELKPGDLLPEADLIAELGVSRTVLREAIKVLGAKGLVEARPRTGTKVSARNHWRLMDPDILAWQSETGLNEPFLRNLAEVRFVIEPAATRLAAQRATEEEIDMIEEAYRQMETHVVHSEAFVAADMQFHFGILAACHNEILEQMSSTIGEALDISRKVTIELPGSSEASLPLHKAVVAAIRERDADAAENAMVRLIEFVQSDIDRFVRQYDTGEKREVGGATTADGASLHLIRGAEPDAEQDTNDP